MTAKLTNLWPSFTDRIGIWSAEPGKKPSGHARSGRRTNNKLNPHVMPGHSIEDECSHHCAIPASPDAVDAALRVSFFLAQETSRLWIVAPGISFELPRPVDFSGLNLGCMRGERAEYVKRETTLLPHELKYSMNKILKHAAGFSVLDWN